MKPEDAGYVLSKINNEGFDYCFIHYSNFKEIKDKKFHQLRQAYIDAKEALELYLETEYEK